MRVLLRVLGGLLGLVALLALAAAAFLFFTSRPKTGGSLTLPGLSGPVTVTRDASGIPHIDARKSDADALFALGFVHAQDRLWQMEFQRRVGAGRLSEVLGSAALDQDKFLRTWGFYRAAQEALPALSPKTRSLLRAYTAGVNAEIKQNKLPLEFRLLRYSPEPWTETDSLVWSKMVAFDLGGNWEDELGGQSVVDRLGASQLRVLYPPYPKDAPTILSEQDLRRGESVQKQREDNQALLPATRQALQHQIQLARGLGFVHSPDLGSNDWVISGRFTKSGKPLLADDPHLGLQAPMLWYFAELRGPTLHTIGATFPGLPGVVIGRNERIAWGVTNTGPDVQDLYVEPENAKLSERAEVIKVKGGPDVRLIVQESAHGPIISGVGGAASLGNGRQRVALKWTALQPGDTTLDAFLGLGYARGWGEFTNALKSYVAPMQNFVYADVDGNIGYYAPGRVPLREGWDGSLPASGDGAHEWKGYIPFQDLPHAYNPPEGLIVTANNKVVPDSYPYELANEANWAQPYRAKRILELVRGKTELTVQDMAKVQNDTLSLMWREFKPLLLAVTPESERERQALDALRAWDGRQTLGSVGSTIFAAWYSQLAKMPNDELGQGGYWNNPQFLLRQLKANGRYCADHEANISDCAAFLRATLKSATDDLASKLGDNVSNWRWEELHRTRSDHGALGGVKAVAWIWNRSIASPGGLNTVNVGGYDLGTFRHTHAPSLRQIVDLSDMNASKFVGTLGQSGNPLSAHYADQQELWRDGKYLPMSTDAGDWGKTSVLTLNPAR